MPVVEALGKRSYRQADLQGVGALQVLVRRPVLRQTCDNEK